MRNRILTEDFKQIANSNIAFEKFRGKTFLITGASGMLGGYLASFLLYLNETRHANIKVIALSRNRHKLEQQFAPHLKNSHLKLMVQDVSTPINIKGKIDYIIHAASLPSPKYFGNDPVGTILPNVIGTKNLLDIAVQNKIEGFVFISSSEVYGSLNKNQIPTKETDWGTLDPTAIRSTYAESKRLAETMCVAYHKQFGTKTYIIRPFHVYGPGMDLEDGRVFADFTRAIVKKENIVITSAGTAIRSFCYISDFTLALFKILNLGKSPEAYNIGNNKAQISVKKLAQCLAALFPKRKIKVLIKPGKHKMGYLPSAINKSIPNLEKLEKLNWQPKHSIKSGFKRTILSYDLN